MHAEEKNYVFKKKFCNVIGPIESSAHYNGTQLFGKVGSINILWGEENAWI